MLVVVRAHVSDSCSRAKANVPPGSVQSLASHEAFCGAFTFVREMARHAHANRSFCSFATEFAMSLIEAQSASFSDAPLSAPLSRPRLSTPIREVVAELCELEPSELADVQRYAQHVRATRGDRPSPDLISHVVATVSRLHLTYAYSVPIPMVRVCTPNTPRALVDRALFEAEARRLLRLDPVKLPAPFIEISAGIQHPRGLLYWIVPLQP